MARFTADLIGLGILSCIARKRNRLWHLRMNKVAMAALTSAVHESSLF